MLSLSPQGLVSIRRRPLHRSAYADDALELLPVDQFLRVWGNQDVDDPHRLMLNRLTHEMVYR